MTYTWDELNNVWNEGASGAQYAFEQMSKDEALTIVLEALNAQCSYDEGEWGRFTSSDTEHLKEILTSYLKDKK